MNERDSAKMEEMDDMNKANASGEDGGGDGGEEDTKPATLVEVANVRVASMVRMATVDK